MVERAGRRERRWPLADLRTFRLAGPPGSPRRALALSFGRSRCVVVSHSWAGRGRVDDRMATFAPFVRALAERAASLAPNARFATAGFELGEAFTWTIGLIGLGAAALLLFSISAGAASLGLALSARMVFVLILMLAALPWLKGGSATLDPRAIPHGLLP